MKALIRKVFKKLRIHRQYKTERVGEFLITYQPSTDIGGQLYKGGQFEQNEIDIACKYIDDDSTVLDIGANIGIHSLYFSRVAKNGLVIAFDPQPKTFRILEKNIYQNNIANIIPLNLAISNTAQIAEFYVMSDDGYSSLIHPTRKKLQDKIKVLCTRVDNLVGDMKVELVKIDVEGLEFDVLKSMSNLLQRCNPVIMCEIFKGEIESHDPQAIISYLRNIGYSVNRIIDGEVVELSMGLEHDDRYYNYLFLPPRIVDLSGNPPRNN
jgi:FkbM family methyltransferase